MRTRILYVHTNSYIIEAVCLHVNAILQIYKYYSCLICCHTKWGLEIKFHCDEISRKYGIKHLHTGMCDKHM